MNIHRLLTITIYLSVLHSIRASDNPEFFVTVAQGVAKISATKIGMGLAEGLIPLGMGSQRDGNIALYSPVDNKIEEISVSSLLTASQLKSFSDYPYLVSQQSLLIAASAPEPFKSYPTQNMDPESMVVTPLAFENRICVLFGPNPTQIGASCVVTDVTTKKDITTFQLASLPMASCVDHMMWISDHQILCSSISRRSIAFFILDLNSKSIIHNEQLRRILNAAFINNKLMLFYKKDDGTLTEKPFNAG